MRGVRKNCILILGVIIFAYLFEGCAVRQTVQSDQIHVVDNINGASKPVWALLSNQNKLRVEADLRARDCTLDRFVVTQTETQGGQIPESLIPLAESQGEKGIVYLPIPHEKVTILARYIHTVLIEEGSETKAPAETENSATGQLQIGKKLSDGFRFDHYDFSSRTEGPGGASAWIKEAPFPGRPDALLKVGWYYDRFSKVTFHWRIYAIGPCGEKP